MLYWSGHQVTNANLNKTFAFDAIVEDGANTSGAIYGTVDLALAAGHKYILVRPGGHTGGFTVSTDGVVIVGGGALKSYDGGTVTGVVFDDDITIAADYVHVERIGVTGASGSGFNISAGSNHIDLVGCAAAACAANGFAIDSGVDINLIRCRSAANANHGFYNAAASGASPVGLNFDHCWSYNDAKSGFVTLATESTTDDCRATFTACEARAAQGGTVPHAGFIPIGAAGRGTAILQGCRAVDAAAQTAGYYVYAPAATGILGRVHMIGNSALNNGGYGIVLSAASARVVLLGNEAEGNGDGQFSNATNCPGYVTHNTNL